MGAVQRIEAAIQKLEALKAASSGEPWATDPDDGTLDIYQWKRSGVFEYSHKIGEAQDAQHRELIVTLHRTINAQLAILRAESVTRIPLHDYPGGMVLSLADAILGDESS